MKDLKNKVAVVTGAGSGIGRQLAHQLAKAGAELVLADVAQKNLEATVGEVHGKTKITSHVVDVSKRDQVYALCDAALKDHGHVDIVINNAGVTVLQPLDEVSYADFEWVMNVNFWGVVYGTLAFLQHLKTRPEASIVNISSVNGFVPFPNNGPYNCSKYAVYGFNETLHQELASSNVLVTSVHPGGIKTNIVRNAKVVSSPSGNDKAHITSRFDSIARTSAEDAAKAIVGAIKGKKKKLLIGLDAHAMDLAKRLMPEEFTGLVGMLTKKMT
jgi:NAD(P)-dependent dehydrogenase (short-subunit alcohol dehydrogenase family)